MHSTHSFSFGGAVPFGDLALEGEQELRRQVVGAAELEDRRAQVGRAGRALDGGLRRQGVDRVDDLPLVDRRLELGRRAHQLGLGVDLEHVVARQQRLREGRVAGERGAGAERRLAREVVGRVEAVEAAPELGVADVGLEGDLRRGARGRAARRRVALRAAGRRREAGAVGEDDVDAEELPGEGRRRADVALEVDRAHVEGVRADLVLGEAPLEGALVHERGALEAARLVAVRVDLALEGDVGLVRVEGEDRVEQERLGGVRHDVEDDLGRHAERQRHVGPREARRRRVGQALAQHVDGADLERVLAGAQVQVLGRVLAVLPGESGSSSRCGTRRRAR